MNSQNKLIEEMANILHNVKDFTSDSLPVVAKEVLSYALIHNLILLGLGVLILAAASFFIIWAFRNRNKYESTTDAAFFGILLGVLALTMIGIFGSTIMKIKMAPHTYLIEYSANLIRK